MTKVFAKLVFLDNTGREEIELTTEDCAILFKGDDGFEVAMPPEEDSVAAGYAKAGEELGENDPMSYHAVAGCIEHMEDYMDAEQLPASKKH